MVEMLFVANYIIEKTNEYNKIPKNNKIYMSCKRLQKLLYFCDVEYIKEYGQPMLKDEFYAWPSGPVIPSVYFKFKKFQDGIMSPIDTSSSPLNKEQKIVIDKILNKTNGMNVNTLIDYSHVNKGPWHCAFSSDDPSHRQIISKESIKEFYKENPIFE